MCCVHVAAYPLALLMMATFHGGRWMAVGEAAPSSFREDHWPAATSPAHACPSHGMPVDALVSHLVLPRPLSSAAAAASNWRALTGASSALTPWTRACISPTRQTCPQCAASSSAWCRPRDREGAASAAAAAAAGLRGQGECSRRSAGKAAPYFYYLWAVLLGRLQ